MHEWALGIAEGPLFVSAFYPHYRQARIATLLIAGVTSQEPSSLQCSPVEHARESPLRVPITPAHYPGGNVWKSEISSYLCCVDAYAGNKV